MIRRNQVIRQNVIQAGPAMARDLTQAAGGYPWGLWCGADATLNHAEPAIAPVGYYNSGNGAEFWIAPSDNFGFYLLEHATVRFTFGFTLKLGPNYPGEWPYPEPGPDTEILAGVVRGNDAPWPPGLHVWTYPGDHELAVSGTFVWSPMRGGDDNDYRLAVMTEVTDDADPGFPGYVDNVYFLMEILGPADWSPDT